MNVVSRAALVRFWTLHPEAEGVLNAWWKLARAGKWKTPQEVRDQFGSADFVGDNRVIFNVGGNNYRVVARISYRYQAMMIKFVGTHQEYDKIDAETV